MPTLPMSFASDNCAGVHPEILEAIVRANSGHAPAYGEDEWTARVEQKLRHHFGSDARGYLVLNGTAANVLCLEAMTRPYHAVLCSEHSHLLTSECGAPARYTGCHFAAVPTADGKIRPAQFARELAEARGNVHHSQPRVISISQTTERGTVYTAAEIRALADFAHANGMFLHLDGARLSNAAAALGVSLRALTTDCGVDVVSFGGTKNGLLLGEAVVFLNPSLGDDAGLIRKQGMQLASKMRFIACQFEAYLTNDLWLRSARHANEMARLLEGELAGIPGVRITQRAEASAVFAELPEAVIKPLRVEFPFHIVNPERHEARLMCSFDTTADQVRDFARRLRELCR